jgi:segregation and condensation protein A
MGEGVRISIPPGADIVQPYPLRLPQFEGPMDLLLHLIRKNEVDIRNIPVAEICRQYHEYLLLMQELDLEVAGEFLYVEALLVQIKSALLLPREAEGGKGVDPRRELADRIIQYRRIKAAAEGLHVTDVERIGLWPRPSGAFEAQGPLEEEADLSEVSVFDLLNLFKSAMERYRELHPPAMQIQASPFSIREKMDEILGRISGSPGPSSLAGIFSSLSGRAEAIAIFLALLELLRLRIVIARQENEFGEIVLERTTEDLSLEGYEEAYR